MISTLVSFFLRLLEKRLRLWSSGTPWDYVQSQTNLNIHEWLNADIREIRTWVVVGAYLGEEFEQILHRFPNCTIDAFEPSIRYHQRLLRRFLNQSRVKVRNLAISNRVGESMFFETTLEGSGSLLPLGNHKKLFNSNQAEAFEVETTTLDSLYRDRSIDVLQIDVQGAEKLVLQGAENTLRNTRAVLMEVSVMGGLYVGGAAWIELNSLLQSKGFIPILLGMDSNLTGNALFIKSHQD
jgi:FkbM family methyltransferase